MLLDVLSGLLLTEWRCQVCRRQLKVIWSRLGKDC
jgi:hypothetical protein